MLETWPSVPVWVTLWLVKALEATESSQNSDPRATNKNMPILRFGDDRFSRCVITRRCTFMNIFDVGLCITTIFWINRANSLQVSNHSRSRSSGHKEPYSFRIDEELI
jgi:hypothetical protein